MKMSGGRFLDFPDLFCEFSTDQDPRVRANSLQALVSIWFFGTLLYHWNHFDDLMLSNVQSSCCYCSSPYILIS